MLTVALEELTPPHSFADDPDGMRSTRFWSADKLEMVRRVRDTLEAWA
jgi:hypothetical protein